MCLIGAIGWVRGGLILVTQIIGGIAAAGIVSALFPDTMNVRTTLSDNTSITRGLFIEMFLTAMLVFTVFMLAAEKHKSTFLAPIGIGLALFIAEMSGKHGQTALREVLAWAHSFLQVSTSLAAASTPPAPLDLTSSSTTSTVTTGSTGSAPASALSSQSSCTGLSKPSNTKQPTPVKTSTRTKPQHSSPAMTPEHGKKSAAPPAKRYPQVSFRA